MDNKKTLVVGASTNESRYSNMATNLLINYGHSVYAFGLKEGLINNIQIHTQWPEKGTIDTVTMYIGAKNQENYFDIIKTLAPRRVIFNPGTENYELSEKLKNYGIEVVENCTLIMLRGGIY
ncbi:MAG: CoA-binding protein [Bacteroidales bacterium]|nr:CoA-binding protein [Bacteroidales bacterium]